jgi:nucleotide-binding universal stress UspA family protein
MNSITQIICPVDFSNNSDQAARVAASLARRNGAELELIHVIAHHPNENAEEQQLFRTVARGAETRLLKRVEELKDVGTNVRASVLTADKSQNMPKALLDHVNISAAQLLVVSSNRAKDSHSWISGSLATALVEGCAVPTLVVHDPASLLTWSDDVSDNLRVMAAVEDQESGREILQSLRELGFTEKAELVLGHVSLESSLSQISIMSGNGAAMVPPVFAASPYDSELQETTLRTASKDLAALAASELPGKSVEIKVDTSLGAVGHVLSRMAVQEKIEMVAIGTHDQSGLSRFFSPPIGEEMLREANCNVLCIPVPEVTPEPIAARAVEQEPPQSSPAFIGEAAIAS